jgi:hypothetical protein
MVYIILLNFPLVDLFPDGNPDIWNNMSILLEAGKFCQTGLKLGQAFHKADARHCEGLFLEQRFISPSSNLISKHS